MEKLQSSDESSIDELSTDLEEYYSNIIDSDESGWIDYDGNNDGSEVSNNDMESEEINASLKECKKYIFQTVL